jgi:hypothetical protein
MDEEMIRYLLSIGVNPFDPGSMNQMGGIMPLTDNKGNFRANTNTVQDIFQIQSDPAFLARLGDNPGGYRQQDFQSQVSYEPVQALGYATLERYLGSSDPVSRVIATIIKNGGTSNQAEAEIRKIVSDPDHEFHAEIMPSVMTYEDDLGQAKPDWQRIRSIATDLEKAVITDPAFELDEMGNPISVTERESEAAKYFREAGLPMPDERYGRETFDAPDDYARYVESQRGLPQARMAAEVFAGDSDRLRQEMMRLITPQQAGQQGQQATQQQPEPGVFRGGPTMQGGYTPPHMQEPGSVVDGPTMQGPHVPPHMMEPYAAPQSGRRPPPPPPTPAPAQLDDPMSRPGIQGGLAARGPAVAALKKQIANAERSKLAAQRDARDRHLGLNDHARTSDLVMRMAARRMEEQGRTPLNDTLAARRQAMLRFGIQT